MLIFSWVLVLLGWYLRGKWERWRRTFEAAKASKQQRRMDQELFEDRSLTDSVVFAEIARSDRYRDYLQKYLLESGIDEATVNLIIERIETFQ